MRPGRVTRGKWRILDVKEWEWSIFIFRALKVVALPMSVKDRIGWALLQQALIMYWRIRDLWGPTNLVASTVAESDDNLPRFMDVQWDSVRATHELPIKVFTWKTALGQGRTRSRLFDSHHESCPFVLPPWLTCAMLSGYFPCKVYIDSNLHDTLGYRWWLDRWVQM
jgi:hypothetical protein